eukprot:Em0009g89a
MRQAGNVMAIQFITLLKSISLSFQIGFSSPQTEHQNPGDGDYGFTVLKPYLARGLFSVATVGTIGAYFILLFVSTWNRRARSVKRGEKRLVHSKPSTLKGHKQMFTRLGLLQFRHIVMCMFCEERCCVHYALSHNEGKFTNSPQVGDYCQRACLGPRLEMGCGVGYTNPQSRPADVLVPNWDLGKPAAFDLSVTSTLHPSVLLEASMTAGSAALVAENRKHKYNDRKCEELGWVCIPLVVEIYGCWGAAAVATFSKLAGRLSTRLNQTKPKTIFGIYSRQAYPYNHHYGMWVWERDYIARWNRGKPAALDITGALPLTPAILGESSRLAGAAPSQQSPGAQAPLKWTPMDIKVRRFDDHQCTPSPTEEEVIAAADVLTRMSSTSPQNPVLQCPARGRVYQLARGHSSEEISHVHDIVCGGEASTLLENEIKWLGDEEKQHMLVESGIAMDIKVSADQGLAIKAGLAISWHKLRHLRRWLKASGISIASEEKMQQISREMIRGNPKGEIAPFSFSLKSGGEEIRGAALVYVPNLVEKVFQLRDENAKDEVWIKLGGDKGGETFEMSFPIVNVPCPIVVPKIPVSSAALRPMTMTLTFIALDRFQDQVEELQRIQWRVLSCLCCHIHKDQMKIPVDIRGAFEARTLETITQDNLNYMASGGIRSNAQLFHNCISKPIFNIPLSQVCLPGLHITPGVFTKILKLLEDTCHELDLKLACSSSQIAASSSTFDEYHQEMLRMPSAKEDLTSQIQGLKDHIFLW